MKHEILINAPEVIKGFLIYSETIKNKSANSVNEYYCDLRSFFRYILLIRGLSPADVEFRQIDISGVDLELLKKVKKGIIELNNFDNILKSKKVIEKNI